MKKILITGQDSYIGQSLEQWLRQTPDQYSIDTIDMRDAAWQEYDFSDYEVVFHVAGIAHVSADPKLEELYYRVNRDLALAAASKAKEAGVRQFIFMSSIIVYGDSSLAEKIITAKTKAQPDNFYGDSKLQAEQGLFKLRSSESDQLDEPSEPTSFKIVILRPPVIYGKASKGNYPKLAKLARITPIFPAYENKRSMLHIDNLCEFIKIMIDREEEGIFFPQNAEYVSVSNLVQTIAQVHGRKVYLLKSLNLLVKLFFKMRLVNKVFGNLAYDMSLSDYETIDYRVRNFQESVELTEQ